MQNSDNSNKTRKKLYTPIHSNENGKLQPQAVEMEEAVLGAALLESDSFFVISVFMKPKHFYIEQNGFIFQAMLDIASKSEPIDTLTVVQQLKRKGELEIVGGSFYVSSLTNRVASSHNIEHHARIVIQKFMMRETILFATQLIKKSYDDTEDCFEVIDWAGSQISAIVGGIETKQAQIIEDIKNEVIQDCKDSLMSSKPSGIPISITKLQEHTNGWQPGHFIVLAGRPAMGKTAVALDYAIYPAIEHKIPTAIFSLEMTAKELAGRLMSKYSHVSSQKINNNTTDTNELSAVMRDSTILNGVPFWIDDTPSLSINQLRSKAFRLVQEKKIELIVIDYLQLMDGASEGNVNREQEISKITRGLKKLSRELEIPIIALSQMSREVEKRISTGHRPQLSDLRESGSIEQDADMIIFLLRPEYYGIQNYTHGTENISTRGLLLQIIAKFRGGGIADIKTRWHGSITSITDWDKVESPKVDAQGKLELTTPTAPAYKDFTIPNTTEDNLPF